MDIFLYALAEIPQTTSRFLAFLLAYFMNTEWSASGNEPVTNAWPATRRTTHQEPSLKVKATVEEILSRIPGPVTVEWPMGERFAVALAHGTMSVEYYAPIGHDPQTPHEQDEVYFIHRGTGQLVIGDDRHSFNAGDCLFVPAHVEHRFENFSSDFGTWVVFWGPKGGEKSSEGDSFYP